ncbi:MAG: TldD/PmbA family protein [Terriglobales bacterium]
MLTQDKAEETFQRIRKYSQADELDVLITGGTSSLTRFANNTVTQNVSEENYVISIRSVFSGRTARSTTNRFDDESLKRAVKGSESLARVQEKDPELLPVADPSAFSRDGFPEVGRAFFETASCTPEDRAKAVDAMVRIATKHNLTAAGIVSNSETVDAVLNSRGLVAYYTGTSADMSVTMLAPDSSGWQKANSPDVRKLDPVALAETAAQKAIASAQPQELPPGKYTVILEPAAVLDLLGFMFWDWGGLAILDQRSFLTNRVGTKLFGDNISIWDDAYHPLQSGPPFDGEGVRRRRVQLVENGVVKNLVYARGTAEKIKRSPFVSKLGEVRPTGHGLPLPNEIGEIPLNIVFQAPPAGQAKSIHEMIVSTERGILVTRLWYIREVDPYEKILTGMTRDGTFYIEAGKLRHGLRNFRFNESLIHMLSNVEQMSEPVRASGEESFDMVVPAMKVRDFNFTEVTKF